MTLTSALNHSSSVSPTCRYPATSSACRVALQHESHLPIIKSSDALSFGESLRAYQGRPIRTAAAATSHRTMQLRCEAFSAVSDSSTTISGKHGDSFHPAAVELRRRIRPLPFISRIVDRLPCPADEALQVSPLVATCRNTVHHS